MKKVNVLKEDVINFEEFNLLSESEQISKMENWTSQQWFDYGMQNTISEEECFAPVLELINKLEKNSELELGSYKIISFPLSHDVDCCGYRISSEDESLLYATDTGYINSRVMKYLYDATYYIFESNHDIEMLMNSNRPYFLKSRILSDKGHLSNEDASEILLKCIGKNTKEIHLAHISKDCNTKKLAYDTLIKTFDENKFDYNKIKIQKLQHLF